MQAGDVIGGAWALVYAAFVPGTLGLPNRSCGMWRLKRLPTSLVETAPRRLFFTQPHPPAIHLLAQGCYGCVTGWCLPGPFSVCQLRSVQPLFHDLLSIVDALQP